MILHYLQFDGVNDHVQLTNAISVNWGTDAYVFEFTANIKSFAASANVGIIGSITSSTTGITMRSFSSVNSLSVMSSGSLRYESGANFLIIGEIHTYRLEHEDNGDYIWFRDGVPFSSGNFSASAPATIQAIGQARSVGLWAEMDLYQLSFVSGFSSVSEYTPSASTTTLFDSISGNNGTLINGPTPVAYESGEPEPVSTNYDIGGVGVYSITGQGDVTRNTDVGGTGEYTLTGFGLISLNVDVTGIGVYSIAGEGDTQRNTDVSGIGNYSIVGQGGGVGVRNFDIGGIGICSVTGQGGVSVGVSVGGIGTYNVTGQGGTQRNTDIGGIGTYNVTGQGGYDPANEIRVSVTRLPAAKIPATIVQSAFTIPKTHRETAAKIPRALRWN